MNFDINRTTKLITDNGVDGNGIATGEEVNTDVVLAFSEAQPKCIIGPLADAIIDGTSNIYSETLSFPTPIVGDQTMVLGELKTYVGFDNPINRYFLVGKAKSIFTGNILNIYVDRDKSDIIITPDTGYFSTFKGKKIKLNSMAIGYDVNIGGSEVLDMVLKENNGSFFTIPDQTAITAHTNTNVYTALIPGMVGNQSFAGYTERMHYADSINVGHTNILPMQFIEIDLETIFGTTVNLKTSTLIDVGISEFKPYGPVMSSGVSKVLIPVNF